MTDTSLRETRQIGKESGRARGPAKHEQPADAKPHVAPKVEPAQLKFLMERVRRLAALLASPPTLQRRAKDKRLNQVVLVALPSEPLLHYLKDKEPVFRWHCYRSGRVIEREGGEEQGPKAVPPAKKWMDNAHFINEFERKLADVSSGSIELGTLSSQFGIIDTTPAWADVKRAISRLSAYLGGFGSRDCKARWNRRRSSS